MDKTIADQAAETYNTLVDMSATFMWPLKLHEDELPTSQEAVLHELKRQGRMNLTQLAHQVSVAKQTMTDISTKLIKLGYIRRIQDESNRRQILLELTPEGRTYVDEYEHARLVYLKEHVFASFSDEQLHQIHDACQTICKLLDQTAIGEKYGIRGLSK